MTEEYREWLAALRVGDRVIEEHLIYTTYGTSADDGIVSRITRADGWYLWTTGGNQFSRATGIWVGDVPDADRAGYVRIREYVTDGGE